MLVVSLSFCFLSQVQWRSCAFEGPDGHSTLTVMLSLPRWARFLSAKLSLGIVHVKPKGFFSTALPFSDDENWHLSCGSKALHIGNNYAVLRPVRSSFTKEAVRFKDCLQCFLILDVINPAVKSPHLWVKLNGNYFFKCRTLFLGLDVLEGCWCMFYLTKECLVRFA